jgi:AcrR family transcriptional regulator
VRSIQKVDLIFEATILLLEVSDVKSLKTNAIAERAGVSIGTLYQYFDGKEALLHELAQREIEGLAQRVTTVLTVTPASSVKERVHWIVGAVLEAYGGRRRAHRLLIEHALGQGGGKRLDPLYAAVSDLLSHQGALPGGQPHVTPTEAYVLTHAFAGVLRALVSMPDSGIERSAAEAALVRLIEGFLHPNAG